MIYKSFVDHWIYIYIYMFCFVFCSKSSFNSKNVWGLWRAITVELKAKCFPMLDIGFQLLNHPVPPLTYFPFHSVPNVLCFLQADQLQHPDCFAVESCCCNTCRMLFWYFAVQKDKDFSEKGRQPMLLQNLYIMQHLWCLHRCTSYQAVCTSTVAVAVRLNCPLVTLNATNFRQRFAKLSV